MEFIPPTPNEPCQHHEELRIFSFMSNFADQVHDCSGLMSGDGNKTWVFYDNWIPGVFPLKAVARSQEFINNSVVSSLIGFEIGKWNGQLILII